MTTRRWKNLLVPFCMGLLLLTACDTREKDGYAGYDTADWATWDTDSDEQLNSDEFRNVYNESGYYDQWDTNQDRAVDEGEWEVAMNSFMGPDYEEGEYGSFNEWDADADGVLNDQELGDGVFAYYDTDRNNYLVEQEYGVWSSGLENQKTKSSTSD
jgi:hypothetical protein